MYKISEDFEASNFSDSEEENEIEEGEEDQLFPRSKKIVEFQLPRDFITMLESEGGFLKMHMPLSITSIGKESDEAFMDQLIPAMTLQKKASAQAPSFTNLLRERGTVSAK